MVKECRNAAMNEITDGKIDSNRPLDKNDSKKFHLEMQGKIQYMQVHYKNIRSANKTIELAKETINKIKYNPVSQQWFRMESGNENNGKGNIVQLQLSWIKENFTQMVMDYCIKVAVEGTKKFLATPVGDVIEVTPKMDLTMNPAILF